MNEMPAIEKVEEFIMDTNAEQHITMRNGECKKYLKASKEDIYINLNYPDKTKEMWIPVECQKAGASIKSGRSERLHRYVDQLKKQ